MYPEPYHLSATVPVPSVQYLEWLGLEARRTGGLRLPKTTVIRALINVAMRLDIDVTRVCTQGELEQRIWEAIERNRWEKKGFLYPFQEVDPRGLAPMESDIPH